MSHQAEGRRYVALRDVIAQKLKTPFQFLRREKKAEGRTGQSSLSTLRSADEAHSPLSAIPSPRTSKSEDFWALKGVSFDVRQGEVVGIIGSPREIGIHPPTHRIGKCTRYVFRASHAELPFHRGTNGAGKSTLLKILRSSSPLHITPLSGKFEP